MKRTPLYSAQRAAGARFVDFGGWELPVQYTGIQDEHAAVRTRAGLFDVSHMGEIELRGPHAVAAAQELTVNDVGRLADGQAQYSLLCLPTGGVVDDIMVHRLAADRILLCVNAANVDKDLAWIREHAGAAEVVDRSDATAQLALQGPLATEILRGLTDIPLADLPPFACREGRVAGCLVLVAHTGYTGEDGWELYCAAADAVKLWETLRQAGEPHGMSLAGLGARDTLRLERALPLYGHELSEATTPLEAGLAWVVRFAKPSFVGRAALQRQRAAGVTRRLVGLAMCEPGIPRQGYAIVDGDRPVGTVTSGTKSPTLGKAIGLGYVASGLHEVGTHLGVKVRERIVRCEVVALPFYRRAEARR
ncbi:glycine cleavage system aminomethyltransferase GcvT [Candidatus Binatia bacterium]|nr:glycine cleavage system aminomethyltransferase GcvT [Candidatus Binatia bacterium]